MGLIPLFKPILEIPKYIVILIYVLFLVYFFRYIFISEAIYITKLYFSITDHNYLSVITSSLFVWGVRGPKIKTRMLGHWIQLFCLPKACYGCCNAGYYILQ